MDLKELRISKELTQKQASNLVNIPLRTYKNYENDKRKIDSIKYNYIMEKLNEYGYIDEEHGIITLEAIKKACQAVFSQYEIEYCYLFGSYAKKLANEKSDIDLLVSTTVTGLEFFGLIEKLRVQLKKKVELLSVTQLSANPDLINEILKDGIKIYE